MSQWISVKFLATKCLNFISYYLLHHFEASYEIPSPYLFLNIKITFVLIMSNLSNIFRIHYYQVKNFIQIFILHFPNVGLISLIIDENDVITSHVLKKVRVSRTLEYYEHIKTKRSQKSSLLKICTRGHLSAELI